MEANEAIGLEGVNHEKDDARDDAGQIGESCGHRWLESDCRGRNRCCCCRDGAARLSAIETRGALLAVVGKLASTIFAESHREIPLLMKLVRVTSCWQDRSEEHTSELQSPMYL